jgi:predicted esterase
MHEPAVSFNFKARYFKLGEINSQTKAVWFVLHGYGQLAKYFLNKFKSLVEHDICVIAPEGLSRYYLQDVATRSQTGNNRVGASWMTRENRLMDIENYVTYLNAIYTYEMREHAHLPVTLVGFSQGAATVSRWVLQGNVQFETLVLWSGIFPDDIDFQKGKELLKPKRVFTVYGKADPFLTEARMQEMTRLSASLGLTPKSLMFDGGHEIHEPTLLGLI